GAGLLRIAPGQPFEQQGLELLGADAAVCLRQQLVLARGEADGPLEALAADACTARTTEDRVLGRAGVVAVEIGWGEVLDQVEFEERAHGISLPLLGVSGFGGGRLGGPVELARPALAQPARIG